MVVPSNGCIMGRSVFWIVLGGASFQCKFFVYHFVGGFMCERVCVCQSVNIGSDKWFVCHPPIPKKSRPPKKLLFFLLRPGNGFKRPSRRQFNSKKNPKVLLNQFLELTDPPFHTPPPPPNSSSPPRIWFQRPAAHCQLCLVHFGFLPPSSTIHGWP